MRTLATIPEGAVSSLVIAPTAPQAAPGSVAREGCADREQLHLAQRVEHGGSLALAVLRALQVDRDGHRAAPVRARSRELGKPERVPRVSVDRAAAGPVAEEGQTGRVRARAGRLRAAGDEPPLLRADRAPEQSAAGVAADKAVQVGGRQDDPARGPGPARGEDRAQVLRRAVLAELVTVEIRAR